MKVEYSPRAVDALENAPAAVRKAFGKQVEILTSNLMHPSLRAKKYNAAANLWQARVNRDWRFYFVIAEDRYLVTSIIPHPK